MMRTWPLVGRDAERTQITSGIERGRVQLIIGAAGVGKTRLVSEVLAELAQRGMRTARIGGAASVVSLPFAPFRTLTDGRDQPNVASVVAAMHAGRDASSPVPVLQIDDAHLLDESSASLVYQLALDGRVGLVLTVRSETPLPHAITSTVRDVEVDRITVEPLDSASATDMATAALGGPLDGGSAHRLVRASGGNPLVLRELTEAALSAGVLVQRAGLWRLTRDVIVDPVVHELVGARIGQLDPEERDALELLALAGSIPLGDLASLVTPAVIERLERERMISVTQSATGERTECAHPIYGEVLLTSLPRVARLRHCRRLAALVERESDPTPEALTQATMWHFEAGDHLDADRLLETAEELRARGDLVNAGRLAVKAVELQPAPESVLLASWCLGTTAQPAAAHAILRKHADLATQPDQIAALALREAEQLWWANGDHQAVDRVLEVADTKLVDSPWRELLVAQRGVFEYLQGELAGLAEHLLPLIDHELPGVRTTAALALEMTYAETGRPSAGAAVAEQALIDALTHPIRFIGDPGIHFVAQTLCRIHTGELDRAEQLADMMYGVAVTLPAPHPRGWASLARGQLRTEQGRFDDAIADLTEAELIWADLGHPGLARWCAARVAIAAASRRDRNSAIEALERLIRYSPLGFELQRFAEARALALTAYAFGEESVISVASEVTQLSTLLDAPGECWTELSIAAVELALCGAIDLAFRSVQDLPADLDPIIALRRDMVRAARDGDANQLRSQAESHHDRGANAIAAKWFMIASAAFEKTGDTGTARECRTLARESAAACQGLEIEQVDSAAALSHREREIVGLAAQGWSNRKIAQHLVLSERTIENHLYRAFSKLGVTSRDQLSN